MNYLFNPGGVRENARQAVADHIKRYASNGERIYLGLPHELWSDFHVVRRACKSIIGGFGVEKDKHVLCETKRNEPYWCITLEGSLAKILKHKTMVKISAGWIDLMGTISGKDYEEVFDSIHNVLDPKFKQIPMSFTWFSSRDGSPYGSEDSSDIGWDFSTTEQRHTARYYYAIERLQSREWVYTPTDVFSIRQKSPMRVMNGVFTHV